MGRQTLIELFHILAGLAVGLAMTVAAAWAYPLGETVIWWCGATAMVVTVAMGIEPLRDARTVDRTVDRAGRRARS